MKNKLHFNKNVIIITGEGSADEKKKFYNFDHFLNFFGGIEGNIPMTSLKRGVISTHEIMVEVFEKIEDVKLHLIGNGYDKIEASTLKQQLIDIAQNIQISETNPPLIIINAHGGLSQISSEQSCHALALATSPIESIFTGGLMKMINEAFKSPVEVILASCHGGAASNYAHLLPKESKLVTLRSDSEEISGSYMIQAFKHLQQKNLSSIYTLDILKAYFEADWQIENTFPLVKISGYSKKVDFQTYISEASKQVTNKNIYEVNQKKQTVVNNILYDQYYETHSKKYLRCELEEQYAVSLKLLEREEKGLWTIKYAKSLVEEIKILENKEDNSESKNNENMSEAFHNYWFSDNQVVNPSEVDLLKNELLTVLNSSSQDLVDAYLNCIVDIGNDSSYLLGNNILDNE